MTRASSRTAAPAELFAGATLIVTRPAALSAALKRRIVAQGGAALSLPGIGLRATPEPVTARAALRKARLADMVIFISPIAVRCAFTLLPTLRFARTTRIFAMGAGTARALARRGLRGVIWPAARQDSEGLLALPELARLRGRRVALIGAPGGRDVLPGTLRARGATLQSIHVYQRSVPRLTRRHFDALALAVQPLLTLLSSAEALDNLRAQLSAPLFAKLAAGDAIVSSLRLAQAARRAGFARTHIAASAGVVDMLGAASRALAQHRL
ncbi:MAG TPA: uroporphyrinogen-III synthase [Rudaea sp.]|jgi:uroporphyrinogen-III synthase|uniref:uroporphyrinogen-III synthase n=1 Tax=Rudaea sp. TaxID=2136325 RepID=UPI002F95EBFB